MPRWARESFLQDLGGMVEDFGPGTDVGGSGDRQALGAVPPPGDGGGPGGLVRVAAWTGRRRSSTRIGRRWSMGSAFGGLDLLEAEQARMIQRRSPAISPYLVPAMIINQAAGQIAQHLGLYGPSAAPANACASGGHAVVLGAMFLRSGEADVALCGAGESAFTPPVVNGFATMKALLGKKPGDRSEQDPAQASRPFSGDRAGFVLAEGAGALVLATESAVHRLGLEPQAELVAWATNSDGHHMAMPCRERIARCLTTALERGRPGPRDDRLLQRPRHQHGPQRPGRDPGRQGRLRRRGAAAADQLDQGGAGP